MITKHLKITKDRDFRINFKYKEKHYSIQEFGAFYEEYIGLSCKEDEEFFVIVKRGRMYHDEFLPTLKHGQTYKQADLSSLYDFIAKFIEEEE